jgi:nicotinamide-nucleotide amidase
VSVADLVARLSGRGETLAVAESLTGGLLAAAIVDVPGASRVFRGGLVVYATDLKASLAGVPDELLARRGPVDPDVARALAAGARRRCGADWGLATTGVAGPEPQHGTPVGTVYVACAGPGAEGVRGFRLDGDRPTVRKATVAAALQLLAELVPLGRGAASSSDR